MSVNARDLENPERDIDLVTRDGRRGRRREWPKPAQVAEPQAEVAEPSVDKPDEVSDLESRLAVAMDLRPGPGLHWLQCWQAGRDATVAAIRGGGLEAGRKVSPPETIACRDCFGLGRNAVLNLIGGNPDVR